MSLSLNDCSFTAELPAGTDPDSCEALISGSCVSTVTVVMPSEIDWFTG